MINISNCSIRALVVTTRWARMNGYPKLIKDITPEQNEKLQLVCDEVDRRAAIRERWKSLEQTKARILYGSNT